MSFILLGILNAQVSGVAAEPAYDLLETTILSSSASSVTFTSLNSTYGSTYKHLQIRYTARYSGGTGNSLYFTMNGDTANNYASHLLNANGSSVDSFNTTSRANIAYLASNTSGGTGGVFAAGVVDILDPFDASKNTTTKTLSGLADGGSFEQIRLSSGLYMDTSAITSIDLAAASGDLVTGCRFSLYGIKAA